MIKENYTSIKNTLPPHVALVVVSKNHTQHAINTVYQLEQRDFGESKVQELMEKHKQLPQDIRWHFIGHLQTNKVKQIIPFIYLIQSVDSEKLIEKINNEARKINKKIEVLLQVKITDEDTKQGLSKAQCLHILNNYSQHKYPFITIKGLMGMASFTNDKLLISNEFQILTSLYNSVKEEHRFGILSMGMSDDYPIAIENGSTLIRVGSKIFGSRSYG